MLGSLVLFVAGLVLLIIGADLFSCNAARMACEAGISPVAIGFFAMAFGASMPELFVGIAAGVTGNTDIALGTGIGGSIASMLLVLGITAIFYPLHLYRKPSRRGLLFVLMAIGILWIVTSDRLLGDQALISVVSRSDGLILLCFFFIFREPVVSFMASLNSGAQKLPEPVKQEFGPPLKTVVGCFCLTLGARLVVDKAEKLAGLTGISEQVMGVVVIGAAVALPKLVVCMAAARRGYAEMAVGTVIGAVFFNIFFVLGISATVHPMPVSPLAWADMAMLTLAAGMLFVFLFVGRVRMMGRPEGGLAVLLYLAYAGYLLHPLFALG